ncbi:MAG TPA: tetratricopeptide repeat protein, partial [Rhizomicrobium sp.]|nr:tetratricopeptide repeat protein [Rhizomicrobium sp.]
MIRKPRNPHDALFKAAEKAGHAFERRKGAQLRQNARTAQQQKNWAVAESLWRQALQDEPGERASVIGLAQVLVYNGKFDEAAELAAEIVAKWPADENGPTVLARLAEERGDTARALAQWRRVLELQPTRGQALIRLGRLMI